MTTTTDPIPLALRYDELTITPRERWLVLLAAFLGWMFDGVEMGIFPLVARPALQEMLPAKPGVSMDAPSAQWMGIATALFLVGAAAGGVAFGWLGDRLGRVRAMALSVLVYSLFTASSSSLRRRGNSGCCGSSRRWGWAGSGRWAWRW